MRYFCLLIITALLASCSPMDRLNRLHRKHPYLFENIKDTIRIKDSVLVHIPGTNKDTVLHYKTMTDTVVLHENNLKVKIIKLPGDTIKIQGECEPITKYGTYTVKVPVTKYIVKLQKKPFPWRLLIIALIIGALVFGLVHFLRTIRF